MNTSTLLGHLTLGMLLNGCADLGAGFQGYNEAYQYNQASWDRFDQEQAIQRLQWDEQQEYRQERFERSIDRIREGIGP